MTEQIPPTGDPSEHPEDAAPTPPPPPADTPPPPAPSPAGSAPAAGRSQYDFAQARDTLQGAHKFDVGIMAAGVIAFLASFMPFYTISVSAAGIGAGSDSASAWHAFFGWFGILVALAGAVVVALALFEVVTLPMPVHQIAASAFGLASVSLILALFVDPSGCGGVSAFGIHCDIGRGFGYWLALLAVLVGTALSFLRARETMAKTA